MDGKVFLLRCIESPQPGQDFRRADACGIDNTPRGIKDQQGVHFGELVQQVQLSLVGHCGGQLRAGQFVRRHTLRDHVRALQDGGDLHFCETNMSLKGLEFAVDRGVVIGVAVRTKGCSDKQQEHA